MKKSLLLASVACLFAVNAQAADVKPYVSAKAKFAAVEAKAKAKGTAPFKNKLDDDVFGYDPAVGAGMKMEEGVLRLELEYTSNNDAEKKFDGVKGKFESYAIFANAYFDFDTSSAFRPYLGIGFGGSRVKFGNKSKSDFAYNYSAGVGYSFNDNISLDLGYRITSYADFDEEISGPGIYEKIEYEAYANEISLGVRFSF